MLYSKFNEEKATEAAASFLKLYSNKTVKYLGLMKLLYTSDRIAFERLDFSITGDNYIAMEYGPVLSNVYDLIKGNKIENDKGFWSSYIFPRDNYYTIRLKRDPGLKYLCRAELKIIEEVYRNVGHIDHFELAEKTHMDFPEWEHPYPARSKPIYTEEILKNVGKSEAEIKNINEMMAIQESLDLMLNV
jgi:uncharacterized phage-associated protein